MAATEPPCRVLGAQYQQPLGPDAAESGDKLSHDSAGTTADQEEESTLWPTIIGTLISTTFAAALVVPTLKAGYTPPVSNLTIMPFTTLKSKGMLPNVSKFFVNIVQVAGTAGVAVTAGIAFSYPAGLILQRRKLAEGVDFGKTEEELTVDVLYLMLEVFAGTLMGSGLVQKFAAALLRDGTDYPMPEANMCVAMLNLIEGENETPYMAQSLWFPLGLVASLTVGMFLGYLPDTLEFKTFSDQLVRTRNLPIVQQLRGTHLKLPAVGGITTFGVGAILPGSVVLLTVAGSALNWVGNVTYLFLRTGKLLGDWQDDEFIDAQFPDGVALQWTGAGAMTASIVWTLAKVCAKLCSSAGKSGGDGGTSDGGPEAALAQRVKYIEVPRRYVIQQWVSVGLGLAIHFAVLLSFQASWAYIAGNMVVSVLGGFGMTYLGSLLSLQIGSGSSPVSGTTLVLGLMHCANLVMTVGTGQDPAIEQELLRVYVPLTALSLAMNCTASCFASDAVQDFATIVLMRTNMYYGFLPQLLATIPACVLVPLILYASDGSMPLGTIDGLPAPQASTIGAVLGGVVWGSPAYVPLCIGLVVGLCAVLHEEFWRTRGMELPAMAFAVGLYLPPNIAISMGLGFAAKSIGTRLYHRHVETDASKAKNVPWVTMENSLCAAAYMTGSSIIVLVIGLVMNMEPEIPDILHIVKYEGYAKGDMTNPVLILPGLFSVAVLMFTIGYNSFSGHQDPTAVLGSGVRVDEGDDGSLGVELAVKATSGDGQRDDEDARKLTFISQ